MSRYSGLDWRTHAVLVHQAMRQSVFGQVMEFRTREFNESAWIACPVTGRLVTAKTCEVDHEYPLTFEWLTGAYLHERGLSEDEIEVKPWSSKRYPAFILADQDLSDSWAAFHFLNAKLRILSKAANRAGKRNRFVVDSQKGEIVERSEQANHITHQGGHYSNRLLDAVEWLLSRNSVLNLMSTK